MITSTPNNTNALILSTVKSAFPAFNGGCATYNQISKMFLSNGWQSSAGNVYQEGARISNNIVVKYSIGHGYYHTFLNGINIYTYDGDKLKLLVSDHNYYNYWWTEQGVHDQTIDLLTRVISDQCRIAGCRDTRYSEIRQIASGMVDDTIRYTEAVGNHALASGSSMAGLLK